MGWSEFDKGGMEGSWEWFMFLLGFEVMFVFWRNEVKWEVLGDFLGRDVGLGGCGWGCKWLMVGRWGNSGVDFLGWG